MPIGIAMLVRSYGRSNYAYSSIPQLGLGGRRSYQPRGRGIGGSSRINAMVCTRGQPEDYDGWAQAGCTGWGWDELLPIFRRIETNERGADTWHGDSGPLFVSNQRDPSPASEAFIEAASGLQYPRNDDFNGADQEGVGLFQLFQKNGRRFNAGQAFIESRPRSNLTVLPGLLARKVNFVSRRAVSVLVGSARSRRTLTARREIILSAGAFGSPQLLMLSGVGPARDLSQFGIEVVHDLPSVGKNLQDHPDFTTNILGPVAGTIGINPITGLRSAFALSKWYGAGRGLLTSNVAEAGGFIKSGPGVDRPDLQLHFCVALVDDHGRRLHMARGYSIHVCALRPASRGEVRLASADPAVSLLIDPALLTAPEDMDVLMKGVRITDRIIATPPLSGFGGRRLYGTGTETDQELRELIRQRTDTIYHPVGTCRMGSDSASVLDPQLRVRGVTGLRVADASIMPTLISGNTQAPSAVIGERAADFILQGK